MAHGLLGLPLEILHCVLVQTDPQDVARLCCCHTLTNYIRNNHVLFKDIYLRHYDEPSGETKKDLVWESELSKLVRFHKLLQSDDIETKKSNLATILSSIDHLLVNAATGSKLSLNIQCLSKLFESSSNVQGLMCSSLLFALAKAETLNKRPRRIRASSDSESMGVSGGQSSRVPLCWDNPQKGSDVSPRFTTNYPEMRIRQMSAKLHVLYGVPIEYARHHYGDGPRYALRSDLKARATHPYARSLVYDLRRYTDGTLFGPFMDDYSQDADWEKLEAIMVVLSHNMRMYVETFGPDVAAIPRWDKPFAGASPHSFVSPPSTIPRNPGLPLEAQDPYNVTGTYMRVVCFLDYTDLFTFNFMTEVPNDQPRHPLGTEEAFRLIEMKIKITKIEPPSEDDGQALPIVRFKGTSAAVSPAWDPHAVSIIRGNENGPSPPIVVDGTIDRLDVGLVRLTPEGEVRWTSWSIFAGEERYRSEGIQIGGPQSARGVLGTWFDKDYDEHGPAGPTCFWKTTDEIKENESDDEDS